MNKESLKSKYFSFSNSYISYCNLAWASTSKTKLTRIFNRQKHAFQIIYSRSIYVHSKPLMQKMNALNIYQINIFQILRFMHKQKLNKNPKIFVNSSNKLEHKYPRRYSRNNYKQPKLKTRNTSFAINYRGPYDDDTRLQHHHHTLRRPVFAHKVITSFHQRPIKQALHHTNIRLVSCFYKYAIFNTSFVVHLQSCLRV